MKTKLIKTSLLIALIAVIFTSCEKSDVTDVAATPNEQSSSLKKIVSSPEFAEVYKQMEEKFNEQNRGPGAQFVLPFFTSSGFGLGQNLVVIPWCDPQDPNFCFYQIVAGQLAFFDTQLGPQDFFRENPDGTVTVHINSKTGNASHLDVVTNVEHTGTNAKLNMTYTGEVLSFSYEDWETGEIITIYYLDMFSLPSALSFHGNGKVRVGNTGPFNTLISRWVLTPGGQENSGFNLN